MTPAAAPPPSLDSQKLDLLLAASSQGGALAGKQGPLTALIGVGALFGAGQFDITKAQPALLYCMTAIVITHLVTAAFQTWATRRG